MAARQVGRKAGGELKNDCLSSSTRLQDVDVEDGGSLVWYNHCRWLQWLLNDLLGSAQSGQHVQDERFLLWIHVLPEKDFIRGRSSSRPGQSISATSRDWTEMRFIHSWDLSCVLGSTFYQNDNYADNLIAGEWSSKSH